MLKAHLLAAASFPGQEQEEGAEEAAALSLQLHPTRLLALITGLVAKQMG